MKKIPLTKGKFAIVDDEDYEWLNKYKWQADKIGNTYYAVRVVSQRGDRQKIYMHRCIMGAIRGQEIDHRNGNGLDNKKNNLRFCTRKQNLQNQKPHNGSSKYKGVSWFKWEAGGKWRAKIQINYKTIHLGLFNDETDAAKAYDEKAKEIFGEFARPNFEYAR